MNNKEFEKSLQEIGAVGVFDELDETLSPDEEKVNSHGDALLRVNSHGDALVKSKTSI